MSDIDAEQLVHNIETYGTAEGAPSEPTQELPREQASEESAGFQFKTLDDLLAHKLQYKANGKDIEEDLSTILKRASQGYNYAQSMAALKQEQEAFTTRQQELEQLKAKGDELNSKWSRFEEYAQQNPEWYDHWSKAWEARGQGTGESSSPEAQSQLDEQKLQALIEQKLTPYQQMLKDHEEQQKLEKVRQEDQELDRVIQDVRKAHPDIDFDATDPDTGKSLEYKVLEFAAQNDIKRFDLAFKAFYHDELLKRQLDRAADSQAKQTQTQNRMGVLGEKSLTKPSNAPNTKNMTWDQLTQLAASDLAINS